MARILLASSLVLALGLGFVGCSDDDDDGGKAVETGTLVITLSENVKGAALVQKDTDPGARYTNDAGNQYGVELFEYLLTDFTLAENARSKMDAALGGVAYRNVFDAATNTLTLENVPVGSYAGLSFYWGVAEEKNYRDPTGPNGLPGDVPSSMDWPDMMGGGYHCNRFNGVWDDQGTDDGSFALHMGRLDMGGTVTNCHTLLHFALDVTVEKGQQTHLSIAMDLDKLMNSPQIDFAASIGSSTWHDATMPNHAAQAAMRDNMDDVFEVSVTP